jgi:hypothetical protein
VFPRSSPEQDGHIDSVQRFSTPKYDCLGVEAKAPDHDSVYATPVKGQSLGAMEDRCRADSKTKARRETHKGHMGTTGYFQLSY